MVFMRPPKRVNFKACEGRDQTIIQAMGRTGLGACVDRLGANDYNDYYDHLKGVCAQWERRHGPWPKPKPSSAKWCKERRTKDHSGLPGAERTRRLWFPKRNGTARPSGRERCWNSS